jgi:nitrate/nitrite transporter NarK
MPFIVLSVIALAGAAIHVHRDKQPRSRARTFEIFLVWWMAVGVGVGSVFGSMFHFFDQVDTAKNIGFTNGDGGFQTEVGFADLALGVVGIMCIWFRDRFLLAAVVVLSIMYLGDAYGHLHQMWVNDNHARDNTGLVLWADFIQPLVAIGLLGLREWALRHPEAGPSASAEPSPSAPGTG